MTIFLFRKLTRRRSVLRICLLLPAICFSAIFFSTYKGLHSWETKHKITDEYAREQVLDMRIKDQDGNISEGVNTTHIQGRQIISVLPSETVAVTNKTKDHCKFPTIDPFDPVIMAGTKFYSPINCSGGISHLVYMMGENIQVNHSRTNLIGDKNNKFKECRYKSIAKRTDSDYETVVLHTSEPFNDWITIRESDENLVVECFGINNAVLSRSYFSLIRVKKDLELLLEENFKKHIATNAPKEVLNVLMIGIDGNSKQNFQRHMPKCRNFLLNDLNAIEMHQYNKLADHTYPNLVPLLTGKTAEDIERPDWKFYDFFDNVNDEFLWSDFRKVGYRTGAFFDDYNITAFHFMKKGWAKPPVDYYLRATILEQEKDKLMKSQGAHCLGDIPEITHNLDFWLRMASTFNSINKPFFGFSFSVHLTHDDHNGASAGDDLYLRFLQEMKDRNILNNTVMVFFSDHGQRFGATRLTYNGMIESMTPFMFLIFPEWFHRKYPDLIKVLKINQERLTTNKDIHATLRELTNFQAKTGLGDINKKGISLFQEIPRERTCEHAGIGADYCVCNQVSETNVSASLTMALAVAVLDEIGRILRPINNLCYFVLFKSVLRVTKIRSDYIADNRTQEASPLYHITMSVKPSDAIYEAKLVVPPSTKKVQVVGDIIRLNLYRGQDFCVNDPRLKLFCFCLHK